MDTASAIRERKSVRKYLDRPVSKEVLYKVLDIARWAPSGANCQPWRVEVVSGETKDKITKAILEAKAKGHTEDPDIDYYPEVWRNPYKERRFKCGLALYSALGIERGDSEGRRRAWFRNYEFFGAPVGVFVFMPKSLGTGFLVDIGIFIQSFTLACLDQGLGTCIQASLAEYPSIVKSILSIPDDFRLVCGISVGYEDTSAPVNQFRTTRIEVDEFTNWHE
ncbi:MAG: nitroreductase [Thermodesulfobacteria bacterium]|nr:nitroreductase [Thermodesulfobacteriota bacterium]